MVDSKEITFGDERGMDREFGRNVLEEFVIALFTIFTGLVRRTGLVDDPEKTTGLPLESFTLLSTSQEFDTSSIVHS